MGASRSTYARALSAACAAVRRNPKIAHLAMYDSPEGRAAMLALEADRAVGSWVLERSYGRRDERLCQLLGEAHAYVHEGGEAGRVHALWAEQERAGKLAALKPNDLAVHRAVLSLAVEQGTPVLASLRLLSDLTGAQRGSSIPFKTVSLVLRRLEARGLIDEYKPGKRGIRARAGQVSLPLARIEAAPEPDPAVVSHLAFTDEMRRAFEAYLAVAAESVAQRSRAAHRDREERSRPTEEEALTAEIFLYEAAIEEDRRRSDGKAALLRDEALVARWPST